MVGQDKPIRCSEIEGSGFPVFFSEFGLGCLNMILKPGAVGLRTRDCTEGNQLRDNLPYQRKRLCGLALF